MGNCITCRIVLHIRNIASTDALFPNTLQRPIGDYVLTNGYAKVVPTVDVEPLVFNVPQHI